MNNELRRLGVVDTATLANPSGKRQKREEDPETGLVDTKPRQRGKLPRCEHENVADRCTVCNPELAAH